MLPDVPVTVMSYAPSVVEDVVVAVSVEVCAVVLLNVSELEERLQVAGLVALDGVLVTEQVSATVPVYELPGVTVIVDVLLEVAPGATAIFPLLVSAKLLLLGASQKPLHPASTATAASRNGAKFPIFIPLSFSIVFNSGLPFDRRRKPQMRVTLKGNA
jgi:hypothetical protein